MNGASSGSRRILLLSSDLLFSTRVASLATRLGLAFQRISASELDSIDPTGGVLLLDLDVGSSAIASALRAIDACADRSVWAVWGFGPHVDAGALVALRRAGAEEVWPRSALFVRLEVALRARFAGIPQ